MHRVQTVLGIAIATVVLAAQASWGAPQVLVLTKTVSTNGCPGTTDNLIVLPGTLVDYCYQVGNSNTVSSTTNVSVDDSPLGNIIAGQTISPLGSADFSYPGNPIPINITTMNVATATGTLSGTATIVSATDTALVTVVPNIIMTKTVGTSTDCSMNTAQMIVVPTNTQVTYCYKVTNPFSSPGVTYTVHTLQDDVLGPITITPPCTLSPGSMCVASTTTTVYQSRKNVATWTAVTDTVPLTATAMSMAMVSIATPTPTNTPTETPSPSPTETPSPTPTATFTQTPTQTPTATITPSATPTNTLNPGSPGEDTGDPGACTDGIDNNMDGLVDCADPTCFGLPGCVAPAPALSPEATVVLFGVLAMIGLLGVARLRRQS